MSARKFLTLAELEAAIEALSDDELESIDHKSFLDIVQLPPNTVDAVTDLEDFEEDEIDEDCRRDLATEIELHMPRSEDDENQENTSHKNKRQRLDATSSTAKEPELNVLPPKWRSCEPSYSKEYVVRSDEQNNELIRSLQAKSAIDIFEMLFDQDIMQTIVDETKIYAAQKNFHNFDMTIDCLKNFVGILLYTGYNSLPQEKLYWSEDEDIDRQIVRKCMPRNRYFEIKRNIHFNNNNNINPDCPDKIFKIRPLIDKLNNNFIKFGIFSEKLSIDEQMVRYYGHHFMKQFIRGKPIRFGLKQWIMACGETGYCFKMTVYQGKESQGNKECSLTGVGEKVVGNMVQILDKPSEHQIYIDNFFTSHKLITLLSKKEIRCTGTARYNRMGMKNARSNALKNDQDMKKVERGFYDYKFDTNNEVLALIWKDNNAVKMLSNHQSIAPLAAVKRYSKTEKKYVDLLQPNLIGEYNKYMGGVDKLDWHVQKYRIKIRGKKWYFPLFTNAIDVAVYNAYILYSMSHGKLPFLDFKRMIAQNYLKTKSISNPKNMGRPSSVSISKRISSTSKAGPGHIIERTFEGKQRKCALCKKNARKQCRLCNVGIHIECFEQFHEE